MLVQTLATVVLFAASTLADSPTCYLQRDDQIVVKHDWVAMPGTELASGRAQTCCREGDSAGPDSICRSSHVVDGNEWYIGGCTDSAYNAGTCESYCCMH
jgi:hypothetical protein